MRYAKRWIANSFYSSNIVFFCRQKRAVCGTTVKSHQALFWFLILSLLSFNNAFAHEKPHKAAIASAHPLATEAGLRTLQAGGNAFDAAVTVSAVLGVVEPYSSGLGGGGFWLLHRACDGYQVMIDGRERAPLEADRDLYLDDNGHVTPLRSLNGALAAGIPSLMGNCRLLNRCNPLLTLP